MLVVFAGAGASKAVEPNGYPTTQEFFAQLPNDIAKNHLFVAIAKFLQTTLGKEMIDIEQWLWACREAREIFNSLSSTQHVAGWLLDQNRLANATNMGVDFAPLFKDGSTVNRGLDWLEDMINRQIYDLYSRRPSVAALKTSWLPLFDVLLHFEERLELVTTNYDVVLEEAISVGRLPIQTGRTLGTYPELLELPRSCRLSRAPHAPANSWRTA